MTRAAASVERIAHYRIVRRIGRGGMGVVYHAVDERDGRAVALKVIRSQEGPGDDAAQHVIDARERFDREAEILRGLLHVNIVSFFEIGEDDGTPYLAMEFLEGAPLGSFAGRPYTETLPLLIQAAHGLEYLASRGIVHRDLSPDNVFVIERAGANAEGVAERRPGGERIVKLLDFGVAKLFDSTGLESLTATGFFLGKVAYGSPEQLGSIGPGAALDWRSDVYSLGLIFFEVLSGHRPFACGAPVEYIAAHLNTKAPPVAAPASAPSLPIELVRLVGKMLEKRRENRPASYRDIVDGLVAVLRDAGSITNSGAGRLLAASPEATQQTELVGSRETRGPRSARQRLSAPLARAAIGVVILAGILGVLMVKGFEDARTAATARKAEAPAAARPLRAAPPAAVRGESRLQLLATPFARVLSVTELATGRRLAVPGDATTPYLVDNVRAGTYRVVLSCPELGGKTAEREVAVRAGETALLAEPFLDPAQLAERLQ